MYTMMQKTLKDFYNIKDTQGQTHNGFLQSMNFSGLTFPVLNEVTISILDAYIFNRLSHCVALRHWADYLQYDATAKEIRIDADFYAAFVNALYVELMEADKFNTSILKGDFSSLSAKDLKKITYGEKTTNKHYDTVVVEITKGNDTEGTTARTDTHTENTHTDTENIGTHTDTTNLGERTDDETLGARSDSHSETAHTDTITPGDVTDEHLRYALGGSTYQSDTKDIKTQTATTNAYGATSGTAGIGQQINERVTGDQENSIEYGAQENSTVYGAKSESDVIGAQTITKTFGDQNKETSARDDSEVIESRIDQEEHTKHILISPEKYFEIEKELASINAYTIMSDAVKRAFAASCYEVEI